MKNGNAAEMGHKRRSSKLFFVLAEQFFPILYEADDHHHARPNKAGKEHYLKQLHGKDSKSHMHDCSLFSIRRCSDLSSAGGRTGQRLLKRASTIDLGMNDSNAVFLPRENPCGILDPSLPAPARCDKLCPVCTPTL